MALRPVAGLAAGPMAEELEIRRKRLTYRARHRGTKELDLLIGSFADAHLASFDSGQLERFENLLSLPEPQLYNWMLGEETPPEALCDDVLTLFLAFKYSPRGA